MFSRLIRVFAACGLGLLLAGPACLAADYPTRSINLVVPYGPGTGSDLLGRVLGQFLGQELGRNIVVQNKPGATGGIGTMDVVKAVPDGYTLVLGTNATLISTPILYSTLSYRPDVDLTPVAMIGRTAMILVARTTQPAPTTLPELVDKLKSGPATYGSSGLGTVGDVISRIMLNSVGAKATLVPYKGSGDELVALIQGDTNFVIDSPTAVLPMVKSGMLRPIAVTGTARLPQVPDTPTFEQLGVKDLSTVYAWFALMAPPKLPADVAGVLGAAMEKVEKNPQFAAKLESIGIDGVSMQGAAFKAFVTQQVDSYGGFIRSTGLKLTE